MSFHGIHLVWTLELNPLCQILKTVFKKTKILIYNLVIKTILLKVTHSKLVMKLFLGLNIH